MADDGTTNHNVKTCADINKIASGQEHAVPGDRSVQATDMNVQLLVQPNPRYDVNAAAPTPVSSPTLVGRVAAGVISGVWGMTREAALSCDRTQTSKFEYRHLSTKPGTASFRTALPQSGSYGGYFYLQVPGKPTPIKVTETAMTLVFTLDKSGMLNVHGQGLNRYGPFAIYGTCEANGHGLELAREYVLNSNQVPANPMPSKSRQSGKDLSRVHTALIKPQRRSQKSADRLPPLPVGNSYPYICEAQSKRSVRARKVPLHLLDGSSSSAAVHGTMSAGFVASDMLNRCLTLVASLGRTAGANWFLEPVDGIALGVPHYRSIIDVPMDLGTVKHSLDIGGFYTDPRVVAADIRLIFRNAMTFNVLPEAPVHEAARDLHAKFEDQLKCIWKHHANTKLGQKRCSDHEVDTSGKRCRISSVKNVPKKNGKGKYGPGDDNFGVQTRTGMVPIADLVSMQRQMESMQATIAALQKQASQTEVQVQMNMELGATSSRCKAPSITRLLTFDEKEALSNDINLLPPDKLAHVVKIVQESMPLTGRHDDDEIEVDIETLDNDTLRHLQKYVKASLSKKRIAKRKNPEAAKSEANLNSDARMLECVALGSAGLSPNFDSDDDDDELVYDVLDP